MENKTPYSKTDNQTAEKIRYGEKLFEQVKNSETGKSINRTIKRVKNSKRKRLRAIAVITFIVIYGLFSAFISLNEKFWHIKGVPEWQDLYEAAGISDGAYKGMLGDIAVHFIDVEQGDSALIIAGDKTLLIDGGEISAFSAVANYLNSLKIEKLDYIIASHPHSDHIGSLGNIIDTYGTEYLIMPEVSEDMTPVSSSYENMIDSAEDCGASILYADIGSVIDISDGCTLEMLAPLKDYEDYNNYSLVCRFNYGETSFLFTGDIEETAERDIVESGIDISATVLKVAHHGSDTSSVKVFLQAVNPDYAVISVGAPNDYGHPHDKTLELLRLLDIKLYRTDLHGNVVFFSDGKNIEVVKEKGTKLDVYS